MAHPPHTVNERLNDGLHSGGMSLRIVENPRRVLPVVLLLVAVLFYAGCRRDDPVAGGGVTDEQRARLVGARDALLERLGDRLVEAMGAGPADAISVCADEAIPLTNRVADEFGVRMGRTSHRLRNTSNTPPAWAVELLDDRPDNDVFLARPGGGAGAFLPIRLEARCVVCHGSEAEIPDIIAARLDALYPDDLARGFEPGDIRGYVWVETD